MYLLTFISSGGLHALDIADGELAVELFAKKEQRGQLPELFERRGNDWIRIRPEEGQ